MKKIILFLLLILLLGGAFVAWKLFGPSVKQPEGKYFYVHTGETFLGMLDSLDEKNIANPQWVSRTAKYLKFRIVKPGRYEIKKGMSVFELVRMLRAGSQSPVNFVVTKFRTKEALAARAGKLFEFDSLQMISFLNNPDSLKTYDLDTNTVMAAVVPLSYTLNWNSTPSRLFRQFSSAYKNFWNTTRRQKADSLGISKEQVVTLASIIDEETNAPSDRPLIASVYLNRIRKGMPLQADPTVKFAMKDFTIKRILNTHLLTQSAYNTYLNKGLPPGPICTPAVETIDAVLDSPKTEYLYFVANSNFDGTHIFTTNYNDHMKYAKEYQQALNKR
jgi:UPF0755 protein